MTDVFWDANDIIFINYLQKERIVTGQYYAALLDKVNFEIKKKRPIWRRKNDNAPSHISLKAMAKLDQLRFELVAYPQFFSRFGPQRLLSVPKPQAVASGKRFTSNERKSSRKPGHILKA